MPFSSLTDFAHHLEQRNELVRVSTPVSPNLEITEVVDRISKGPSARNKALLFEQVEGLSLIHISEPTRPY